MTKLPSIQIGKTIYNPAQIAHFTYHVSPNNMEVGLHLTNKKEMIPLRGLDAKNFIQRANLIFAMDLDEEEKRILEIGTINLG